MADFTVGLSGLLASLLAFCFLLLNCSSQTSHDSLHFFRSCSNISYQRVFSELRLNEQFQPYSITVYPYAAIFFFFLFISHTASPRVKWCAWRVQSCLTLCNPTDFSPPGSSVHGILQARILEWAAISSSRGSSSPRIKTMSPTSPALQADSLPPSQQGSPYMLTLPWFICLLPVSYC